MVYVHIDSAYSDSTANSDSNDTENNFGYQLSRPANNVELMVLKHARLPIMPTVIANWNDIVYFYSANDGAGATLLSATLTPGYYTPDELVAEMNTQMTAAATTNTFASTYDANTNKITLVGSANMRLSTQALVLAGAGKCSIFIGNTKPTVFESHIIRCRLNKTVSNPYF